MKREITQRELRNESGRIMRALDDGESFVVTRNGVPVGELLPLSPRSFVRTERVAQIFSEAPRMDRRRLRDDLDRHMDQDASPSD